MIDASRTIRDAMDAPGMFGPHFQGESWAAWRAFLEALFALPMSADALALYQRHTGRQTPPAEPFTEAALVCGRRAGKSRILGLIATYLATHRDYSSHLAPGEVATVAVIAADRRQARTIFRYIKGNLASVPSLAAMIKEETAEAITLNNRVVIEIATASFRVTRGYTFAGVLGDESAFWRSDETSANPDTEILAAIRPGLSSIPGAMLLLASSPYAKRGVLYDHFRRYWAQDGADVLVWRGSTAEMNPKISPKLIQRAYDDDPAKASAEYGALFRDDVAGYVTREVVDACTEFGRHELPKITGHRYVAFVDPSGGTSDSMTLAIAHHEKGKAVLDAVRERKPPFSPEAVTVDFCETLKAYGVSKVEGDRYGGEWPREQFRKNGIAYELSEKPRSDLYASLLPMMNSGQVELLDLPRLTAQLCGLERRTARGGRDSIDHGPGGHDDVANAVAGALLKAGKPKSILRFSPLDLARIGPERRRNQWAGVRL